MSGSRNRHTRRFADRTSSYVQRDLYFCAGCGKSTYRNRKLARKAARRLYPEAQMNTYECGGKGSGTWHYGHLAPAVRAGIKTRDEVYGK